MKALAIFKLALAISTILFVATTAQAALVMTGGNQTIWGCMEAQLEGHYGAGATGAIWSGGGGTFSPNSTTMNATYTPCAAEISAGSTTLTLTSLPPGPGQASATMSITILPNTTASAGGNQTICSGGSTAGLGGAVCSSATNGVWTSSGTGTFAPTATTLNATYTPSAADAAAGKVTLTLEPQPCSVSTARVLVSIQAPPVVDEAPTNLTVCGESPAAFTVVATDTNLAYQWQVSQDGGTTFTNISATATNASYTNLAPTLADNGNQYQVVVSGGGASATSAPPAVLTVNAPATAGAGANQTICAGSATAGVGGTVGGSVTGGAWSSTGTGNFAPNPTTLNATYTPSAADITAGTLTLTLSTTGQLSPCTPATAQVVVTINPAPAANAGANQTICAGSATAGLGSTVGGGATGGTWSSSGTGTFLPNASTLNASYSPSAVDVALGATTLTLTSTGQGASCGPATAQVLVTFNNPPLVINPPVSVTVGPGLPASFSVGATGTALTYQWQVSRNGGVTFTNISATATNASYVTAPTTLDDNNNRYQVVVNGACPPPATSSPAAILTVDPAAGLPGITTHPQSCRTQPGVAVSFTAYSTNATGYQWRFNGVDIPGATGMTLQIANPQLTNSGYYLAIATNANGWVPSQKAYLAVVGDQGVVPFSNVGFAQVMGGCTYSEPLIGVATLVVGPELDQMQSVPEDPWLGPGPTPPWWPSEPITATITDGYYDYGDVVSVPTVSPGQTVYYRVDASYTNCYGILQTSPVSRVLTLVAGGDSYPTPSLSAIQFPGWFIGEGPEPVRQSSSATNQVHTPGETVALTAGYFCYMDFGPPHFQWRKDGAIIPGATNYTGGPDNYDETGYYSPFFTITNAQAADAGNYDLVVNGSYSFIDVNTSLSIRFTNSAVPVLIASQPADLTVCAGSPASFTVTATGTNLVYQWQVSQDGGATFANVSAAATNAAYTNLDVSLADNGNQYQVIVIGPGLSQTSSPPPLLTVNAPATASAGANQTISAYSTTLPLGGSVGGCAAGGVWTTTGTGAFSPSATALNACYTPSTADLAVGMVTLTLTSIGPCAPCSAATAQVVVTIQWQPVSLGTTTLLEGPSAGADSVVLAASAPTNTWTAMANDGWLHLDTANQSGTGSTNVIFSYDANPDVTRTGTLTIGGQTLTVNQAGSSYVAAPSVATTLASSGLGSPWYVDVDGAGSVYIADGANHAIKSWAPMNNTVSTVVTLATNSVAVGVAVDGAGNVYMSDQGDNTLKVWSAANHAWSTLVSSGLNTPYAIAVDWVGNVYIADTGNNAIKAWTVANNAVTTLAGTASMPYGVGVDRAGNVYFPDGNSIKKWTAANNSVTTLFSRSGYYFYGVAVDGAGNVHYSATAAPVFRVIGKWKAASNTFTTLVSSGLSIPRGVAVDRAGNVYFTDLGYQTVRELPHAFVDPTAKTEGPAAGSHVLPGVLPATANLLAPFAPTSDQPWLTVTGITNGVVSFAFEANTGSSNRTAHITLLGQPISITQTAPVTPPTLIGPTVLSNGTIQFAFSNSDLGVSFTVLTATNLSLPLTDWTVAGPATNTAPGLFQFSTGTTNNPQGFYRVRSP